MSLHNLVELEAFFPDIEPELPRCPTPVIENRIRDAIIDSCERANIWRWVHPEMELIAGVSHYTLATPTDDTLIHSMLDIMREGRSMRHSLDIDTQSGYAVCERGEFHLASAPTKTLCVQPVVSIKPSRTTLMVAEVLVRDYYHLICTGSLYKALMMTGRPWSNPELAKEMQKQYELALAKAKQGIDRGFTTGSQRFKPRKFA